MATARVLIVDDDPSIREITSHILTKSGYSVIAAGSGEEALHLVEADAAVDLLISDVTMPGIEGPELVQAVHQSSPATALMLMSAYTNVPVPDGVAFLPKPFRPKDLVAAVERILAETAEAREELAASCERARELRSESRQIVESTREMERKLHETTKRLAVALERLKTRSNGGPGSAL